MKPSAPSEKSHRFGQLQLRIMRLLWQRPMNARDITATLNRGAKEPAVAHSTVQTLLRKLEEKGAVSHRVQDRTFIFHPLVREKNALRKATQDFVGRIFGGSVPELVSHLLTNERLSAGELKALRALIQQKEKKS